MSQSASANELKMFPALSISGMALAKQISNDPKVANDANWCVRQPIMVEGERFLLWSYATGQNGGSVDRLTPLADNGAVIYGIYDTSWPQLLKEDEKPNAVHDIVIETSNTIQLVGVYDGRPVVDVFQRFAPTQRPFAL
jgi:hypothetical protein